MGGRSTVAWVTRVYRRHQHYFLGDIIRRSQPRMRKQVTCRGAAPFSLINQRLERRTFAPNEDQVIIDQCLPIPTYGWHVNSAYTFRDPHTWTYLRPGSVLRASLR